MEKAGKAKKQPAPKQPGAKSFADEINQIRENQQEIFNAFLQISIPMCITSLKESRFVDVNDSLLQFTGYSRDEVIGQTPLEIGLISAEQKKPIIRKLKKNGRIDNLEMVIRTKSGKLRVGLLNAVTISYGGEQYFLSTLTDITQRKQAQESLKESEGKYRRLVENSRDIIYTLDLDFNFTFISPSFQELMGYPAADALGKPVWYGTHRDDLARCKAFFRSARESGQCNSGIEARVRHRDGSWRWFITNINFIIDKEGNICGLEGISKDITEHRKSLELIEESEKKFRLITENILGIILLVDRNYTCQYVSRIREKLGYEPGEITGTPMFNIVHPDDLEQVTRLCREGVERMWNEVLCQARFRHKDGRYVKMEVKAWALTDVQDKFIGTVCIIREADQRAQANKQVTQPSKAASRKKYQLSLRENEILGWIMQGKSTWDISAILDITESTVKYHVDNIMKKLDAVNRPHAVAIALQEELIRRG